MRRLHIADISLEIMAAINLISKSFAELFATNCRLGIAFLFNYSQLRLGAIIACAFGIIDFFPHSE